MWSFVSGEKKLMKIVIAVFESLRYRRVFKLQNFEREERPNRFREHGNWNVSAPYSIPNEFFSLTFHGNRLLHPVNLLTHPHNYHLLNLHKINDKQSISRIFTNFLNGNEKEQKTLIEKFFLNFFIQQNNSKKGKKKFSQCCKL